MSRLDIETLYNTEEAKRFFFPGKLLWGKECRNHLFGLIEQGADIAVFVDGFFAAHPFLKEISDIYGRQLMLVQTVSDMPKTGDIEKIISKLVKAPDMVVSIGGGSTIDTSKAVIARFLYGTFEGVGIGPLRGMKTLAGAKKPVFVSIPTTAGTGADASRYYVTYDSGTGEKVYGRSWNLVADWVLLDPHFVRNSNERLLINSAFDAFVHLFESFMCRHERSWFGDMLSLDGMARIFSALDRIIERGERNDEHFLQLLYASTLAGMAVSNVRTGNIHEAAGALLEHSTLSHPETLFVFLRAAYEQYRENITDRDEMFSSRMRAAHPELSLGSFEDAIAWWERLYEKNGITDAIKGAMEKIALPKEELRKYIFNRVFDDKVWVEKESPAPLDGRMVNELIDRSLSRFGL